LLSGTGGYFRSLAVEDNFGLLEIAAGIWLYVSAGFGYGGLLWALRDGMGSGGIWRGKEVTFVYKNETEVISRGVFLVYLAECGC